MSVIIALIIIDTILQVIVCHFSLWWLVCLICRILFICRAVGVTFRIKKLAIGEAVAFGAMLLFNMFFASNGIHWGKIIFFLLFSIIAVGLEFLDDILYVYVIEDADEDE